MRKCFAVGDKSLPSYSMAFLCFWIIHITILCLLLWCYAKADWQFRFSKHRRKLTYDCVSRVTIYSTRWSEIFYCLLHLHWSRCFVFSVKGERATMGRSLHSRMLCTFKYVIIGIYATLRELSKLLAATFVQRNEELQVQRRKQFKF